MSCHVVSCCIVLSRFVSSCVVSSFDFTSSPSGVPLKSQEEVRAYLLDNPEVLMEAIDVLEQRQAEQQAADDIALVAGGDRTHLPFPDDSLDCVVLSGVLATAMLALGIAIGAGKREASTALGTAIFVWLILVFAGDLGVMPVDQFLEQLQSEVTERR